MVLDAVRAFALTKALEMRTLSDSADSVVETAAKFEQYLVSDATTS